MTVCQLVHDRLRALRRFSNEYDVEAIPKSGIYVVFEKGELAHGGDRIVRVGTHTGENNLRGRLKEHIFTMNKDRSIFRKHIGRCLLSKRNDPLYDHWNLDLTTREKRKKFGNLVDIVRLNEVELEITAYIHEALTFSVLAVAAERIALEGKLLSTLAQCPHCAASENWLGRHHPNKVIAESGLWNIQGVKGRGLSAAEVDAF